MDLARIATWSWLLLSPACLLPVAAAQQPVTSFGDLSEAKIEGLERFDVDQIREQLQSDFDLCLASHPLAPLEALPSVVETRLLAGFRAAGYADATVDVRIDEGEGCLAIRVHEGACYQCGEIQVDGVDAELRQRLITRLTEPYPPEDAVTSRFKIVDGRDVVEWLDKDGKPVDLAEPVWKTGGPAPLAKASQNRIEANIRNALADVGLRGPDFHVSLPRDKNTGEARLHIVIDEAGPVDRVGWVELHGNSRISRKALLDYLQLDTNELLTHDLLARVQHQLWRSGRFASVQVTPVSAAEAEQDTAGLRIDVGESQLAPPLNEDLSREASLLIKTRDMLANPASWPSELVLQLTTATDNYDLVIHPRQGILATAKPKNGKYRFAIALSRDALGYYSADLPVKLECPVPQQWLYFEMRYDVGDDLKETGRPTFTTSFNFGFKSDRPDNTTLPVGMNLELAPAAMVALAELPNMEAEWTDSYLTLRDDAEHLRVDARDGRLISYEMDMGKAQFQFGFQAGVYTQRWNEIRQATAHQPNEYDPAYPLSSLLAFFCQEQVIHDLLTIIDSEKQWPSLDMGNAEALLVVHRLLDVGALHALDELFTKPSKKHDPEFDIPYAAPPAGKNAGWHAMIARAAAPWADHLFPRNSWLWTVWREASFAIAGEATYTGAQLQALYQSDDVGPVGLLAISALVGQVDKRMAERFAARGIWRTGVEEFRKDYAPLLNRDYPIGASLQRAAEILRELNEAECLKLASWIPQDYQPALIEFAAELRRGRALPVEDTLSTALDRAWEAGLRELVIDGLNQKLPNTAFRLGN